jgi:hypothetical protein
MTTQAKTIWRIAGDEVAGCNCDWGCPCQFNALPTHRHCDGMVGIKIREGYYGNVSLDGLTFVELFWFPGAVHEGNGTYQLVVGEGATPEQRDALQALTSGAEGGMPFEIFAAVSPNKLDPLMRVIAFNYDRDQRKAVVTVEGIGELRTEPIKNPVTGEELRARIVLPDGFEFKEAEVANAAALRAKATPPLVWDHSETYAQLNAFDWSNASG